MRKQLLFCLIAVLVLLTACKTQDDMQENVSSPDVVVAETTVASYTADIAVLDEWSVKTETEKEYYVTLVVHSNDFYDEVKESELLYRTSDGYDTLSNVFKGSTIDVYVANQESKKGICSYIKIKTPKMIDKKSIYVSLEGPVTYEEGVTTEAAYLEKHGNVDGWAKLIASVSSKGVTFEETADKQIGINKGVIRIADEKRSLFYYDTTNSECKVDGNRAVARIEVTPIKNCTLEDFAQAILVDGKCVVMEDGRGAMVQLDDNLSIVSEIDDDAVLLGFETKDGSDIQAYLDSIPNAIMYDYLKTSYFVIK